MGGRPTALPKLPLRGMLDRKPVLGLDKSAGGVLYLSLVLSKLPLPGVPTALPKLPLAGLPNLSRRAEPAPLLLPVLGPGLPKEKETWLA
jgi:hypothetical protein